MSVIEVSCHLVALRFCGGPLGAIKEHDILLITERLHNIVMVRCL